VASPTSCPCRAYQNDGAERFADATEACVPPNTLDNDFDVEAAGFDGDGRVDPCMASRGSLDRLLVSR